MHNPRWPGVVVVIVGVVAILVTAWQSYDEGLESADKVETVDTVAPLPAKGWQPAQRPGRTVVTANTLVDAPGGGVTEADSGAPPGLSVVGETAGNAGVDLAQEKLRRAIASNAEQARRNVDRFCEVSKKVSVPRPPPGERDAAVYLSVRVDWEGGRKGLLHLPDAVVQRMGTPPMNWRRFGAADLDGLDFTWFRDLLAYDVWHLSSDGPARDQPYTSLRDTPMPNFIPLQQWAKLRLAKGQLDGDLSQASLEVQHLADLCGSTSTLLGEMIRLAILGIVRGYFESLGLPAPMGVTSASETQAIRQTGFLAPRFLWPGVAPEVREKALGCMQLRCAGLMEAMFTATGLRGVVPEADETVAWLLKQDQCDPGLASRLAAMPVQPMAEAATLELESGSISERLESLRDAGF